MSFTIQVSNPVALDRRTSVAADVADALQRIFPMNTEAAILTWNRVPVRLSYKYDVSVVIDDILPMLDAVLGSATGSYQVGWGSNTFNGAWTLQWDAGTIAISAIWENTSGSYEELLNSRGSVTMPRDDYLREWKALLATIGQAIQRSGIRLKDTTSLSTLMRIEAALPGSGVLYRPTEPVAPSV